MKLIYNKELSTSNPSVDTMSKENFDAINNYISQYDVIGENEKETENNIRALPYFVSGCYTYLQAEAFANYYHRDTK